MTSFLSGGPHCQLLPCVRFPEAFRVTRTYHWKKAARLPTRKVLTAMSILLTVLPLSLGPNLVSESILFNNRNSTRSNYSHFCNFIHSGAYWNDIWIYVHRTDVAQEIFNLEEGKQNGSIISMLKNLGVKEATKGRAGERAAGISYGAVLDTSRTGDTRGLFGKKQPTLRPAPQNPTELLWGLGIRILKRPSHDSVPQEGLGITD